VKILVDMNLSPDWCRLLGARGWEVAHWTDVGAPTATDKEVMAYAVQGKYVVFTHDLGFSQRDDRVVITTDLTREKLVAGDVGTVVHVYRGGEAFEVEFVSLDGETVAVVTLERTQVRPVKRREITHARSVA